MTKAGWNRVVRWSALPAVVAAFALVACAPEDYADDAQQGTAAHEVDAPEPDIVGGADPTAVSGRIRADSESTIHHPGADGNAGRPPDPVGTVTEETKAATPADTSPTP